MGKKDYSTENWQFTWARWVVLITIFLVPVYASTNHWFPFTTPKSLLIIGGSLLAAIFFIWGLIKHKDESIQFNLLHWIALAFLTALSLGAIFGVDPQASFFGSFFSGTSIIMLISLFILACIISEFVRRDFGFGRRVMLSAFIAGILVALFAYFPLLGIGKNWELIKLSGGGGLIGNSSFAGAYLIFALGFGAYLFFAESKIVKKIVIALGSALIIFSPIFFNIHAKFFVGDAQGAALGLAIAVIFAMLFFLIKSKKKFLSWTGVSFLFILAIVISFSYTKLLEEGSTVNKAFIQARNADRFLYWYIADQALVEHPLTGVGFENYNDAFQQHYSRELFPRVSGNEEIVSNPHNIIFDMAATSGILGLFTYIILFGGVVITFFIFGHRNEEGNKKLFLIFPAILIGYFIQNLLIFDTPSSWLMFFMLIGLAMGISPVLNKSKVNIFSKQNSPRQIVLYFFGFIFAVSIYLFAILPARESRLLNSLNSASLGNTESKKINDIQSISLMGTPDDMALFANKLVTPLSGARANLNPENKQNWIDQISSLVNLLDIESSEHPTNFRTRYVAGTLLHLQITIEPEKAQELAAKAKKYFEQAQKINPNNPKVYFNLAQNAMFMQDARRAITYTRAAIAIAPRTDEGYKIGDVILKNIPDKKLEEYLKIMRKRWF